MRELAKRICGLALGYCAADFYLLGNSGTSAGSDSALSRAGHHFLSDDLVELLGTVRTYNCRRNRKIPLSSEQNTFLQVNQLNNPSNSGLLLSIFSVGGSFGYASAPIAAGFFYA